MKRFAALLLALLMTLSMLTACGSKTETAENGQEPETTETTETTDPAEQETDTAEETGDGTREITDMAGNVVTIPENVERVVNLWPVSNSAMLAMGAGELLVGTQEFTKSLPWANFVYPEIADVAIGTDNAEELLLLDPDLVICSGEDTAEALQTAGLPAVYLFFQDYDSMKEAFTLLGDILGGEYAEKAATWCQMVDDNIARVNEALADLTDEERPVVYYIQGQTNRGLYESFRGDSIMEDWTTIAGGKYACSELEMEGNSVQAEAILALNPDVIIIGGPAEHVLYDELMADPAWQDIDAVKNGRVYINPNGLFPWERFGMESVLQILWAAETLHPDLVDVDMVAETQAFYRDFVGVELTDQQAQNLLAGLDPEGNPYFEE